MSVVNFDFPPNDDCQLFVGNLKGFVSEEILYIKFSPYGRIRRIEGREPDFALIEYEQAQSATLAEVETGSRLVNQKIFVKKLFNKGEIQDLSFDENLIPDPPAVVLPRPGRKDDKNLKNVNHIEIIVVSDKILPYAEKIEKMLKKLDFTVDIVKPNITIPKSKIFGALTSSGVLFGIVLEPANVENESLTYLVFYDNCLEYKNVPLKEAYKQIYANFAKLCKKVKKEVYHHPPGIQFLFDLLINNRTLSVLQYDKVLSYLGDRRYSQRSEEQDKPSSSRSSRYPPGYASGCCIDFDGVDSESGSDVSYEDIPMRDRYVGMKMPKKKKPKKDDPINILTREMMIQSISNKIKRNAENSGEKERMELKNKLIDRDRLKSVMDELRGVKKSWY